MTVSDLATTSFDSFTELDTHSFSAYVGGSSTGSTATENWHDYGYDDNVLAVTGTESSTGDSYSFVDTDSSGYVYILDEVVDGGMGDDYNYDLTVIQSSVTTISGTASGSPDPYSFVTYNTGSYSETDSGATTGTLGEVNDFSDWESSSYADEYTITGPPASTVTDEATSTGTTSGDPRDTSNGTLIPAYWDTYAVGLATSMGTSPLDAPIQDGTTTGEWDTSKNLVSALGGQDMHALQFTGAEVQPALSGSAIVLEQGAGGSGTWVSHPSAIGYRRQGYVTSGSHGGSGSTTITIAAVAPEFDSGMNIGADQDETERLLNFSQGAEENPTVGADAADVAGSAAGERNLVGGRWSVIEWDDESVVRQPDVAGGCEPIRGKWILQSLRGVVWRSRRRGGRRRRGGYCQRTGANSEHRQHADVPGLAWTQSRRCGARPADVA